MNNPDPYIQYLDEERDRHNEMAERVRKKGLAEGDPVTPPALNEDGSLADEETRNSVDPVEEFGLWEYKCPKCDGRAYNGDPETGTRFRGGGVCKDCGAQFSVVGLKLVPTRKPNTDESPALAKIVGNRLVIDNAFCPTGKGGGIDPTCSKSGSGKNYSGSSDEPFSYDRLNDPDSAAHGGRKPASRKELTSLWHQTSNDAALKILQGSGLKPSSHISKELAAEGYADTKDGGDYIYAGLNKEAAQLAAVGDGTIFRIGAGGAMNRTVVQPDKEGGIALIHGPLKLSEISIHEVITDDPKVKAAWEAYKKKGSS